MSFIGNIGTVILFAVITSSGLEEIFSGCLKDVPNMLNDKVWPKVFCDL